MLAACLGVSMLIAACGGTGESTDPTLDVAAGEQTAPNSGSGATVVAEAVRWEQCASEGATCSFSGTREVRYGASAATVTRVFANSAVCANSVFGDPAVGEPKLCWHANRTTNAPAAIPAPTTTVAEPAPIQVAAVAPAPTTASTGSVPTVTSIVGKRVVGRIDAVSGQVIENVHVTNPTGPCIVIDGKRDVVIRDSEIGPCGHQAESVDAVGILIANGSTNVTIERNVLHDASALISANNAAHPLVIHKNLFYNIRGYQWVFQAIAVGETRTGTASTRITCNVMDDTLVTQYPMAGGLRKVEDHINFYNAGGSAQFPVELAYNRIRGNPDGLGGISGTGMQLGDSQAGGGGVGSNVPGYFNVHDNIVAMVNGQGIAIAGGVGSVVKDNKVDNRGIRAHNTGWPVGLRNFDTTKPASVTYSGNKAIGFLWAFDNDGRLAPPLSQVWGTSGFAVTDGGGNDWQHAFTTNIWDEPMNAACGH